MAKAVKETTEETVVENGLVDNTTAPAEEVATEEVAPAEEVVLNPAPVEREDPGVKTRAYRS